MTDPPPSAVTSSAASVSRVQGSSPPLETPAGMIAFGGGHLTMGRDDYKQPHALDVPAHAIEVGPFALAAADVTVHEYAEFVADRHLSAPWKTTRPRDERQPVVGVAQADAAAYCAWRYLDVGRLPSEAEWEWAARGAAGRRYPYAAVFDASCARRIRAMSSVREPCGATPEGLFDLSGKVWRWTSSPASLYSPAASASPPPGFFVIRGGSFFNTAPEELTTTARMFADSASPYIGFRCAADLK